MTTLAVHRKLLLILLLAGLFFAPNSYAVKPPMPDINLPEAVQGEQALQALGNRLPAVAAHYGMSVPEFARNIRKDRTLWIDTRGRLFYVEIPEPASPANVDVHATASYPLEQTFLLQSRPGASKTLYLDFDGHVITGTAWNSSTGVDPMYAAPWSGDSDRSSFSDSDLRGIQAMWRQVAEDFAPFDVNVTTADPGSNALVRSGSGDDEYGSRALITPNTAYVDTSYVGSTGKIYNCECGGVAYVGVFDNTSQVYQPALVFNGGIKSAGEAITHEVGHNLGLSHDGNSVDAYYRGQGSGETGWAPVMGVGYYQSLVQWSKGEYFDANMTQDDYAVMGGNGLYPAFDDHGDSPATATTPAVVSSGGSVSSTVTGTIETPADADVFVITAGAGPLNISATPVAAAPNLDIEITLRDDSGALLGSANPTDQLAASMSAVVNGGIYYLALEGVGKGDPLGNGYTDYGSLGGYKIVATYSDGVDLVLPVAAISSDYSLSTAPLTVAFDGGLSQDATSWLWDFGEGNTATGVAVSHTYLQSGVFDAQLTVTSSDGLTDSEALRITVINQPPEVRGDVSTASGEAPLNVDFTDAGSADTDGSIAAYRWDFGDGNSAFTADASHTYTAPGTFGATLTVTDNLGAQSTLSAATIEVTQPAIIDSITSSDVFIDAGTITRSHTATHVRDGTSQSIRERESGGRKSGRYSYATHSWVVNVPGGSSTVSVNGYRGASGDGETFMLSYSIGAQSGEIGSLTGTSSSLSSQSFDHGPGTLTITLEDTDQTGGNRFLDTAYIDQIFVRTLSDGGEVGSAPSAPTNLQASATGADEISLSWVDTSSDEFGFRLERRTSGANWQSVADPLANSTDFIDGNLSANTTYEYRVYAINSAGDSVASNLASATTSSVSDVTLTISRQFKVKGANHVELQWSDSNNAYTVFRASPGQSLQETGTSNNGRYLDDTLGKGGMTINYQVCAGQTCSNVVTVSF